MKPLIDLLLKNEQWLIQRIFQYAENYDYTRYTSTLYEAWRISIAELSNSLIQAIKDNVTIPSIVSHDDFVNDPLSAFAIKEARLHRRRGVSLSMFLGLIKYYRQSYLDLIDRETDLPAETAMEYRRVVDLFFDRVEIGFCTEWSAVDEQHKLTELRESNLQMTNEKTKYLTIFESLQEPVILFNEKNEIENLNHAATNLVKSDAFPGSIYYGDQLAENVMGDILKQMKTMRPTLNEEESEKQFQTQIEKRHYIVKMKKMQDFSQKFQGKVALFHDITERIQCEMDMRKQQEEFLQWKEEQKAPKAKGQSKTIKISFDYQPVRELIEAIDDAVTIINPKKRIVWANNNALQLFGEDIIGKRCFEAYNHDRTSCDFCAVDQTLKDNETHKNEFVTRDIRGASHYFRCFSSVAAVDDHKKPIRVVHLLRDMTPVKQADEELKEQKAKLEETNIALKVMLEHKEREREIVEEQLCNNLKRLVLPNLARLKNSTLNSNQSAYVKTIEMDINNALSPYMKKMNTAFSDLTLKELEICNYIRDGHSTKEIAEALMVSEKTVNFHRQNIRDKLGLANKKINLRKHLLSLS